MARRSDSTLELLRLGPLLIGGNTSNLTTHNHFHLLCRHTPLGDFFGDGLGLKELQQVVRPARLRIRSRHIEPAKRMRSHHPARALPFPVEIPPNEPSPTFLTVP